MLYLNQKKKKTPTSEWNLVWPTKLNQYSSTEGELSFSFFLFFFWVKKTIVLLQLYYTEPKSKFTSNLLHKIYLRDSRIILKILLDTEKRVTQRDQICFLEIALTETLKESNAII